MWWLLLDFFSSPHSTRSGQPELETEDPPTIMARPGVETDYPFSLKSVELIEYVPIRKSLNFQTIFSDFVMFYFQRGQFSIFLQQISTPGHIKTRHVVRIVIFDLKSKEKNIGNPVSRLEDLVSQMRT